MFELNKERKYRIMAKIKCNHCKSKFVYVSGGSRTINFDEVHLEAKLNIKELDGKYYCKECRQKFCEHLIDQEFIVKKASRMLEVKLPKEPDNKIIRNDLGIMKFLEKLHLVKKVKPKPIEQTLVGIRRTSGLPTPTKKI